MNRPRLVNDAIDSLYSEVSAQIGQKVVRVRYYAAGEPLVTDHIAEEIALAVVRLRDHRMGRRSPVWEREAGQ